MRVRGYQEIRRGCQGGRGIAEEGQCSQGCRRDLAGVERELPTPRSKGHHGSARAGVERGGPGLPRLWWVR